MIISRGDKIAQIHVLLAELLYFARAPASLHYMFILHSLLKIIKNKQT